MFPVESVIPAVRDSLSRNRSVVLRAPPGSGKTTCVAPALLDADFLGGRKIVMLEPRRLAARSCASYIASRRGERVGETIGYQVRLERKISSRTRLEIVTEGLLAQRILADPELSDVGIVIFDEFHERSLACDMAFAMALDVRRALRPDLRIVVMSATLDVDEIAAHLGDADVHTAEARMFPVETRHLEVESRAPIASQMAGAVRRVLPESAGDVLCFLPGEGEIRRCMAELRDDPGPAASAAVMPLYGALPKEEQDAALRPAGRRKVVLATSIAETSLTIEGVTTVIDCGLMRVPRFSPRSGMSRLETLRITRDRADQRRGRAGRTAPGLCLRLWTKPDDRLLVPKMKPEILEADLAPTVLASAQWGATKPDSLPWLTPPPAASWANASALLRMLGALDTDGRVTEHGARMARIPVHPRLANMLLMGGAPELAAIIEEGAPHEITDIREVRLTPRMKELARRWSREAPSGRRFYEAGEDLAFAFPDRVAKNRGNSTFTMVSGRGAYMERTEALARSEYLVCCDLDDAGGDAKIHLAAPISEEAVEELFAGQIEEREFTEWDRRSESVKSVRQRRLGRMVLKEKPAAGGGAAAGEKRDDEIAAALLDGIRSKGVANLPCWTPALRQLQARICFLHSAMATEGGESPFPDVSDKSLEAHLEEWFAGFVGGMTRWTHLERLDLAAVMDCALAAAGTSRRELDNLAPTKMEVPSGSHLTIHYEETEPFVEARLQECFGMQETPKVAGGRIPVVMRLLSPAQRPVQITKDLASFWKNGYALVRKDMRGRYPRHYWPEDPFTAVATRRVRPG